MTTRTFNAARIALVGGLIAALVACSKAPPPKPPTAATPAPSKPALAPGASQTAPPSTPPHDGGSPSESKTSAATDDPTLLEAGGISAPKPATWTWQTPTASFRTLQYSVPGKGSSTESAELIVSVFPGTNGGGPLQPNIDRWAKQFTGPDEAPVQPTRSDKTVDGLEVALVELKGAYTGMGAAGPKPNQLQLGAIIDAGDRRIFIRLIGPEATVEAERENWNKLIDGLKKSS